MLGKLDYSTYGGALLAGVNGVVIIGHGRSTAAAISNAIRTAQRLSEYRIEAELPAAAKGVETRV